MLYVFYGDAQKARTKARQLMDQLVLKESSASISRFSDENWNEPGFLEALHSQGLFKRKQLIVVDTLVRHENAGPSLLKMCNNLQESEHIIILVEGSLLKAHITTLEKSAEKIQECTADTKTRPLNAISSFAITDALIEKNPQKLFIELERARLNGKKIEEIVGLLFWAAKTMCVALASDSAVSAQMKEYTYKQGVRGGRMWAENLDDLVELLARAPHQSRRTGEDGFKLLEREIIALCA